MREDDVERVHRAPRHIRHVAAPLTSVTKPGDGARQSPDKCEMQVLQ